MKCILPAGSPRVALADGVTGKNPRLVSFVTLVVACLLALAIPRLQAVQLLPGVYGYGLDRSDNPAGFAYTGGPTPEIKHVTTLVDSGSNASPTPGSLRDFIVNRTVNAGVITPRTIVFDVSGEIVLKGNLTISVGSLTIAGQTAPAGGVALRGVPLAITTSNILIQHLRVRPGDEWLPNPDTHDRDAVSTSNGSALVRNVVFDHCTFAWSLDEIASGWYAFENITYNRCMFADPLYRSIHLDENTFSTNHPIDGESLTPVLSTGVTLASPAPADSRAVSGHYAQLDYGSSPTGKYADYQLTLPSDAARLDEHLVIAGITGTDRGKFYVEIRTSPYPATPLRTTSTFDEYAASTDVSLKTFVDNQTGLGFTIPAGTTALYLRVYGVTKNASSTGQLVSIDLFSLSQGHAMGPLFGAGYRPTIAGAGRVSIAGSVFAHLAERGPWFASRQTLLANSVFYDRKKKFTMFGHATWTDTIYAAVIGNTYIEGQAWQGDVSIGAVHQESQYTGTLNLFRTDNSDSDGVLYDSTLPANAASNPIVQTDGMAGFVPLPRAVAYEEALLFAGARANERDAIELRIASDIATGAATSPYGSRPGTLKNSVADAGGWPTVTGTTVTWVEPTNPNNFDADGYTLLEEKLHDQAAQLEGSLTPDGSIQAEAGTLGGGNILERTNAGFHGTGYVNFSTGSPTNGTLTFSSVNGGAGGAKILRIRYAFDTGSRTGQLVVNGSTQGITFNATGSFTTWRTLDVPVTLTSGATNSIVLKSTGQDLANIDEITIVSDAFVDTFESGTSTNWATAGGTWGVITDGTSKVLQQSDSVADGAVTYALLTANSDDHSVSADAKITTWGQSNSWFGLVTRFTDPSNYYYAKVTTTTAEIKKIVHGKVTALTSVSFTPTTSTWYRLKFDVIGTHLRFLINDTEVTSVDDTELSVGKSGFMMYRAVVEYDNARVDPSPGTLVNDDFNDGNANGWTGTGGTWQVALDGTTVYQQSNTSGTITSWSSIGSSWTDQVVKARVKPLTFGGTNRWFGVMARYTDTNNYYYFKVQSDGTMELKKIVAGTLTQLATASSPVTIATGTWYELKLECIGTLLRAYINGQLVMQATDSTFASGPNGAGLVTYGTSANYDDVLMEQP